MNKRPGGELATRPLHFILLADCSGSMNIDGKIQALNNAIREAIPHMQAIANENPNAEILVRAIKFADGASWHISQPTPIDKFQWVDLTSGGLTDMGEALSLLSEQLKIPPMSDRALPPVLVLISDGLPTDDINNGLKTLMALPWGKKSVRIAIAVGEDADQEILQRFIDNTNIKPLQANNADQLVKYIKWVSTVILKSASSPSSQVNYMNSSGMNVPIPKLPENEPSSATDVW
ncbi:vWA domain-containing protein [Candidatus Marithrix sp. Canyon 246]|uniref:vWA domain-containing protein n=1 Tax=Candidatus Marithrix sp. Canyon 246 TaxID=1827136 RepID=UPI00084A0B4D|nr:VWA domain-containing protein [Candidatus Marithrix sp. Canyon 246]